MLSLYDQLEQRKRFNSLAAQIARLGKLEATNLFTNGDQSNGTTGWTANSANLSVVDGLLSVVTTTDTVSPLLRESVTAIIGHVYYLACKIKPFRTHQPIAYIGGATPTSTVSVTAGTLTRVSFRAVATTATTLQGVYLNANVTTGMSVGSAVGFDKRILLDLTAIFGAGKEPSQAEMDAYLAMWPDSWFDGSVNLADTEKIARAVIGLMA